MILGYESLIFEVVLSHLQQVIKCPIRFSDQMCSAFHLADF
jgi:hypothetical protein